ncbi:MAG TPA: alpha/beta fold hydrolase, partial [Methylomirabilota bacterium]|nr:alpha/beta fold hydrolase [Methylomirabilota bacterium]
MGSNLEIRVLGDLQVLRDGETIELPPSKKARALLAYLAVVERPQRRERLCEMFWDVPDDPRGALRWSLSRIRGILNDGSGDLFAADRNAVAVNPDAVNTDLARVRLLLKGGIDGLDRNALREIADCFRGFFLEDLSLPRCPDFESWRVSHVNELELLRLDVLRRLVDALQGEPELALPYAHQLHRLLPDEPGLPKLVASLADAAKRQSAGRVGSMPVRLPQAASDDAPSAEETTAQPQADVRFCTTRDGVSVAYALTGSGPAIVRAAHWMSHIAYDVESPVWRHWIRDLSAETTLLRYDERGNGLSQWDVDDLGFEAMVSDLESIIEAAGLQRVVLLGVSQSCAISVAYAVRHPERVHGLILYGGYVKGWRARGNPSEIALREAMGTLMREGWGQDDPMFRQLFTSMFIPGASREQMDWFNDLERRTVTPENAFRLAESFSQIDVTDLLPQVGVPTLVMHARGDRVSPIESGKQFAAAIRGARFVELDSNNHILLEEEPAFDIFVREVRRFVAEVTAPRSARVDTSNAKRPVSVLVADIVSPLHAFEMFDPEIAAAALDPIVRIVRDLVQTHGGLLVDSREGMVTAAFGATRAFEQHTVSACRAARAIRDAVANAADGSMKIRIGIDAGEAVVQNPDAQDGRANVAGPVVKGAMRLANALKRDTIALSARARESAGGFVTAVRMTRADCPGVARDETVFELLAENKALSRWYLRAQQGLTPLIGRESELERLSLAWHGAREGRGAAIGVVGNPGVGKSRLAHEFVGSESLKGYTLVEAGAEEVDGSSSHNLAKRILLSFFGLEEGED